MVLERYMLSMEKFFGKQNGKLLEEWWICVSDHAAGSRFGLETGSLLRKDTAGAYNTRRKHNLNVECSNLPVKRDWVTAFLRVLRQEYIKLLLKIQRSVLCKVFWCVLSKLFMLQKERAPCKFQTLVNQKAKWTSFRLFFINQYKSLLISVLGGGTVGLNWLAEYFLDTEFRFNTWKKLVLSSLEVHLLIRNNSILNGCWTAIRKVLQREETKLSLSLFRAHSEWFVHGKSRDSFENGQKTEEAGLGASVSSHLKTLPVACSYRAPGNTSKKQMTLVPLYFRSYFVCITLRWCQRLIIC